MQDEKRWKYDLETYLRQGEPEKAEKSTAWQTAIGLQAVDGLTTSDYLLETAKEHIEGHIDMPAAKQRIQSYYEAQASRQSAEADTMEADLVSVRIAELLSEKTFQFSPAELQDIQLAEPFSFTKGCKTMKIEAKNRMGDTTAFGSMLFDLEQDPGQAHPIADEAVIARMKGYIWDCMDKNDAPAELYDRLGV